MYFVQGRAFRASVNASLEVVSAIDQRLGFTWVLLELMGVEGGWALLMGIERFCRCLGPWRRFVAGWVGAFCNVGAVGFLGLGGALSQGGALVACPSVGRLVAAFLDLGGGAVGLGPGALSCQKVGQTRCRWGWGLGATSGGTGIRASSRLGLGGAWRGFLATFAVGWYQGSHTVASEALRASGAARNSGRASCACTSRWVAVARGSKGKWPQRGDLRKPCLV